MDPFWNGTGKTGTGQVSFTRQNLSEPFHFLSENRSIFFARVNGPLIAFLFEFILFSAFKIKIDFFFMFRDIPGCSRMFHVPGFIDGLYKRIYKRIKFLFLLSLSVMYF